MIEHCVSKKDFKHGLLASILQDDLERIIVLPKVLSDTINDAVFKGEAQDRYDFIMSSIVNQLLDGIRLGFLEKTEVVKLFIESNKERREKLRALRAVEDNFRKKLVSLIKPDTQI